jgi:hypothetical protein
MPCNMYTATACDHSDNSAAASKISRTCSHLLRTALQPPSPAVLQPLLPDTPPLLPPPAASASSQGWDSLMQELLSHDPHSLKALLGTSSNASALSGGDVPMVHQHM